MRVFIFLFLLSLLSISGCSAGEQDMRGDYLSLITVSYHPAGRDDVTCFYLSDTLSCIKER